jgi:hypothetical protein
LSNKGEAKMTQPQFYVNVYDLSRHYGGPEEGGWWYDAGDVIEVHGPFDDVMAWEVKETLELDFPSTGKRFSVLGGEDYLVSIEREPGQDWSNWQRWE